VTTSWGHFVAVQFFFVALYKRCVVRHFIAELLFCAVCDADEAADARTPATLDAVEIMSLY
jgi:hypothetical protein